MSAIMSTVAEWISALATVGALVAATVAGRSAKRLYDIESERDRVAAASREAAAARLMNAWTAIHAPDVSKPKIGRHGLVVSNAGEGAVFDVTVCSDDHTGKAQHPMHLHVLPPGEYFVLRETQHLWGYPAPARAQVGMIRPISNRKEWRVTSIAFMDSAGLRWRRDASGLHREPSATVERGRSRAL